jgi:hypothetical protein
MYFLFRVDQCIVPRQILPVLDSSVLHTSFLDKYVQRNGQERSMYQWLGSMAEEKAMRSGCGTLLVSRAVPPTYSIVVRLWQLLSKFGEGNVV